MFGMGLVGQNKEGINDNKITAPANVQQDSNEQEAAIISDPFYEETYNMEQYGFYLYVDPLEQDQMALKWNNSKEVLYHFPTAKLLHPFIDQHPHNPDLFMIMFMEQRDQNRYDHLFILDRKGSFAEIKNIPQAGYNTSKFSYSPNGKDILLLIESGTYHEGILGYIDQGKKEFVTLAGEITKVNKEEDSLAGMQEQWLVEWLSDQEIVLYHNGFSAIDFAIKKEKALPRKKPSQPFDRYYLGMNAGQRIYLLDIIRQDITTVMRLGSFDAKGNGYQQESQITIPGLDVALLRRETVFSPAQKRSAFMVYTYAEERKERPVTLYVWDTEQKKMILEKEVIERGNMRWVDEQTLLLGTQRISLPEK
ncbi:hypothetical protein EEL31_24455 [Brevibacillus laterosporus]|nr:hypothetical protein EEL31_24455 [Brevibacillus laterosporus]